MSDEIANSMGSDNLQPIQICESQLKRKRRSGENESDDSSSDSESDSKEGNWS